MINVTMTEKLCRDAEVKTSKAGKQFVTFSLPHSESKDGPTTWISVMSNATAIADKLKKGTLVTVTGSLKIDARESDAGAKVYHSISAFDVRLHYAASPKADNAFATSAKSKASDSFDDSIGF